MRSNKGQGEAGKGNSRKGVSGKRKRERSATKHKKAKKSYKNKPSNNPRIHPRLQKSLLLLLKDINLEERSASIANFHLLHLIHRPHTLPRSIQREEV